MQSKNVCSPRSSLIRLMGFLLWLTSVDRVLSEVLGITMHIIIRFNLFISVPSFALHLVALTLCYGDWVSSSVGDLKWK